MRFIYIFLFILMPFSTLCAQQRHSDTFNDITQHIPLATMLIMKTAGLDNHHDWWETVGNAAASYIISDAITYGLKHSFKEDRPDHSDHYSFPSGHATLAFSGATILHKEYGHLSPWVSIGGYAVATLTAIDRVRRDRHHWYDVAAGAGIGFLGTELTYYLSKKCFGKRDVSIGFSGNRVDIAFRL